MSFVSLAVLALQAFPGSASDSTVPRSVDPPGAVVAARPFGGGIDWNALRRSPTLPNDSWAAAGVPVALDTLRTRRRVKAVEYSGFYSARLKLHRWLSFTMIPLFVGSYLTGDQILKKSTAAPQWARRYHAPLATATAVVFTANTVTGLWNLWDARKDPAGRAKRYVHSLLFIAASAGFTYAGTTLATEAESSADKRNLHRTVALGAMGVSVFSWGMMLIF